MKVLLVVPAYNEECNIGKVIDSLKKQPYDILVINDASTDNTLSILSKKNVDYLDMSVNVGIGGGVQAGYLYALRNDYDIVVQFDGDGQHLAEEISQLIAPIEREEADVVIGSRFINNIGFQSSKIRRVGIRLLSNLVKICTGKRIYDVTSGFRAVNKKFIALYAGEYAQDYPEPEAIVTAIKHQGRITEIPVQMRERDGGKSSISAVKSIYYMIKVSLAIIFRMVS